MNKVFDSHMIIEFVPLLLGYLPITLYILFISLLAGFAIGLIVALPRIYKLPVLNIMSRVYISFFRGTPILVQLFVVFYGIPALTQLAGIDTSKMNPLYAAIATYALSSGASIAEIIRGGVNSVDKGQVEAAYSVGLNGRQTFLRIVLPQALYQAMPNFGNLIIGFLKDTSLAFSIGVMDMSGRGQALISSSNHPLEVYVALSVIYYLTALVLETAFRYIEKKLKKDDTRLVTVFDMEI